MMKSRMGKAAAILLTILSLPLSVPSLSAQDQRPGEPQTGPLEGAVQDTSDEEGLPLPVWKPEDRRALITGRLIPGSALLGESEFDGEATIAPSSEEYDRELDEEDVDPRKIPEEFLPRYASRGLSRNGIVDPQQLLSAQKLLDHAHFLELFEAESPLRLRLILFDREQQVPSSLNLSRMLEGQFKNEQWTVFVQYHLGAPKRTQIAFSEDLEGLIGEAERLTLRRKAVGGSLNQSDPDSQLHSLLISLGNQLYWLEEKVENEQARGASAFVAVDSGSDPTAAGAPSELVEEANPEDRMTLAKLSSEVIKTAGWIVLCLVVFCLLLGLLLLYRRMKVYQLPEFEFDNRLGAPHGGGVGPVLKFSNPNLSPTAQRSEAMPDYLTRL